ncbi:hypothetical protein BGY98DRAFT_932606 [Russula aff. rugulosa BPL654]|nr:hypothetical protein BGY98DRAFT_932606 [Russula aff. rugulosa BPL654]
MSEDIMLMESADALERVQHGRTSPEMRMGNAQNNGRQQLSVHLGPRVALTGYRLLATTVIVGTGIPKAVYSYYGQSLISPTLDFLGGVVFGLLLFWLGVIETTKPDPRRVAAIGQSSSYLDVNDREVDLADFIDEDPELCLENTLFTCLRGERQAFGPSVRDSWPSE